MDESHFVDEAQSRNCKKLLAAIIVRAVYDACVPPYRDTTNNYRPSSVARDAIEFLFLPSPTFDVYIEFLNIAPDRFRNALLDHMSGRRTTVSFLDKLESLNKRNFSFNYRWVNSK